MNDLEELFNRQPPYSDDELSRIVEHFRKSRAQYLAGEKPKKSTGPKAATLDLAEFGLAEAPKPETKLKLL